MHRFGIGLAMAIVLSIASTHAGAGVALPPDLAQAARDYDQAQISGNRTELERLLADDYTLVNGAAQVSAKSDFIADSVAPGFTLQPFEIEHAINKVWRDGAVLSGEVTLRGTSAGKAFANRMRFADVWRKRKGHWQVVFTEVTRVPATG